MRQHEINVFVVDNVTEGEFVIATMMQMIEHKLC
jgi:hypothetical protein